jgi:hypothetical protein
LDEFAQYQLFSITASVGEYNNIAYPGASGYDKRLNFIELGLNPNIYVLVVI